MLVLSRRISEKIVMPTVGTTVQVVSAKPGLVRLGVEAPAGVPIYREEVLNRLPPAEQTRPPVRRPGGRNPLRDHLQALSEKLGSALKELAAIRQQVDDGQATEAAALLDLFQLTASVRRVLDNPSPAGRALQIGVATLPVTAAY